MAAKKQPHILITREQMDELLVSAAKSGAAEALKQLGLNDETAGKDMRDIRNILDGFRFARRTVFEAFLRWATIIVCGTVFAGWFFHYGQVK